MNRFGVIMAGGGGTRFWPLSRKEVPKQFLNLTGTDLLVNETFDRLAASVDPKNIFVVTNATQAELMYTATKGRIKQDHILAEPAARNTAACIGYAAMEIMHKYGDGIMCILPSDHYIKEPERYEAAIAHAMQVAEETDQLITIGIKPTFASTGYGYIKYTKKAGASYYPTEEFVEKPDGKTAEEYLRDGTYLWNSGMFVWKASTILKYFEALLPDVYRCICEIGEAMNTTEEQKVIQRVYPTIPKISIDYGIMERAADVCVIEGDFGWNDVGSWDALQALYEPDEEGNITYGEQIHIDTKNCISYAQNKLIATLGVEDLIIVETEDAVLVCHKDRAQDVKKIVEQLENQGMTEYL
ncbi:MAG: mannose-1-phosphate guanylyltransferase [Lachnospiraceae bacterium]